MTIKSATAYLNSLEFHGIKLGLSNTVKLLEQLGNPQNDFAVVHVAGTNGKGSASMMISNVLTHAKIKNGLYVSPHLVTFRERVQVNGKMIGASAAVQLIADVKNASDALPNVQVTYFEFMTAMALLHFSRAGVKLAVLEVGLGGRFDSTNVVDPLVSVITSIAMDHRSHLGGTLASIAFEKCGIIKKGKDVVVGVRDGNVAKTITSEAKKKKAPCYLVKKDFTSRRFLKGGDFEHFNFRFGEIGFRDIKIPLAGKKQVDNAACAMTALLLLRRHGFKISDEAFRSGLANVYCPGRFETVSHTPSVILDGAHNPKAASALCHALMERFGNKKIDFIFGAMADKDYTKMIKNLAPVAKSFMFFSPGIERAAPPAKMALVLADTKIKTRIAKNIDDVLKLIERAPSKSVICVTGSFYTIGEIRSLLVN